MTSPFAGSEAGLIAAFDMARRDSSELVILDGLHPVKHARRFGAEIVFIGTDDRDASLRLASECAPDLRALLKAQAVDLPSSLVSRLVRRTTKKTVVALARRPSPVSAVDLLKTPRHSVLLERPTDHGNLGAVVRVAAAADALAVFTYGGVDPWHPASIRGSAGLHFALPVLELTDIAEVAPIVALTPDAVVLSVNDVPRNAVFTFGSERHGVSRFVRERAVLSFVNSNEGWCL